MKELHEPIIAPVEVHPLADAEAGDHLVLVTCNALLKPVASLEAHTSERLDLDRQLLHSRCQLPELLTLVLPLLLLLLHNLLLCFLLPWLLLLLKVLLLLQELLALQRLLLLCC
jgi:hypothetical protein